MYQLKSLDILEQQLRDETLWIHSHEEAIKELKELQKENTRLKKQLSKDHHIECSCSFYKPVDEKVLKEFQFTSCNDCRNKIDGTYQEICSNCKRFYGCYFEAKDLKC